MKHQQLISRNQLELAEVFTAFHELNACYEHQFVLSLDIYGFELFDLRIGSPIIRHEFSHFRQLCQDMRNLTTTISLVFSARIRLNAFRRPTKNEAWAIKRLIKLYSIYDDYFFNEHLRNYINYGKNDKKQNLADCY